ncbi:MAG TPA: ZIP family metal transporter [Candidatus Sulfomarinibacteraceae bacterium]|nr:ZIP family metal transporter [Candidatus Sulfomarinibacteraceae bacterium]
MIEFIAQFSPVQQALIGTLFTWGLTAAGAATIFLRRTFDRKLLDTMLGFAAGVMIAASYWSLLEPALSMAEQGPLPAYIPAAAGFLVGGISLRGMDMILPHLHIRADNGDREGVQTTWERTTLLVLAITLHNVPEGLAVGVAFGAAAAGIPEATVAGAVALAIGIGIQNFPEAMAVSMPLHAAGASRMRSFWYGQLSGIVEPIAGVLGALAVTVSRAILPYALAFAAGAMIFVVVEDLIPEAHREGNADLATMGAMLGFTVMMVLDVAFG